MISDFNVAPDTFSEENFRGLLTPYIVAVQGCAYMLAGDPENGFDQASCFDFEPCEHLLDAAMQTLQGFAKDNQLFYNTVKLENATTQAFVEAFGNAFQAERAKMEQADVR